MLKPDCVKMANELIDRYPKNFHVENIYPQEYNKLNRKKNVTEILDLSEIMERGRIQASGNEVLTPEAAAKIGEPSSKLLDMIANRLGGRFCSSVSRIAV